MTDNPTNNPQNASGETASNRPDFYIQERRWEDGRLTHRKLGVAWSNDYYASGPTANGKHQIIVHTRDQWDALQELRQAKKAQAQSPEPSQAPESQAPTEQPKL